MKTMRFSKTPKISSGAHAKSLGCPPAFNIHITAHRAQRTAYAHGAKAPRRYADTGIAVCKDVICVRNRSDEEDDEFRRPDRVRIVPRSSYTTLRARLPRGIIQVSSFRTEPESIPGGVDGGSPEPSPEDEPGTRWEVRIQAMCAVGVARTATNQVVWWRLLRALFLHGPYANV